MFKKNSLTFGEFIALLIFGIVVFLLACGKYIDTRKKNKINFENNPKVEGTIENIREVKVKNHTKYGDRTKTVAEISYTVGDIQYIKTLSYPSAKEKMIGQSITVAYEEDDPSKAYIDVLGPYSIKSLMKNGELAFIIFGFIVLMLFVCACYFFNNEERKTRRT